MRSGGSRAGLILTLCLCALALNCPAQETSPSGRSIVSRSVSAWDRNDRLARDYVYNALNETRDLDSSGHVKSVHSSLEEILFIGARRYVHPLERDGKPLSPDQTRREQA